MMNTFFDRIYVLTLRRAKDRQRHIEREMQGLNWEFFFGVDKNGLSQDQTEHHYDDQTHRRTKRTHRSMNLGEIACALSHRAIYQDILDKGYRTALILEDDVMPKFESFDAFTKSILELPADWELLLLGYYSEKHPTWKNRAQQKIYRLYHQCKLFNWHKVPGRFIDQLLMQPYSSGLFIPGKLVGAHAYAVTRSACHKFINYQTPIIIQADRVFNYYQVTSNLKAFALKEKLFGLSDLARNSYIGYHPDSLSFLSKNHSRVPVAD